MNKDFYEDVTFDNLILVEQKLIRKEYDNCIFINCDFSKSDFSFNNFMDCEFRKCNLSMVVLENTGIKNAKFIDCKLTGIDFGRCNDFLFAASFESCLLDYSTFFQKKMKKTVFKHCTIKEVDFTEVDLSQSVFDHCDLLNTNFTSSNLEKVNFKTAVNYTIDPELNKIKKAKFTYAGLAGLLHKYDIDIYFD